MFPVTQECLEAGHVRTGGYPPSCITCECASKGPGGVTYIPPGMTLKAIGESVQRMLDLNRHPTSKKIQAAVEVLAVAWGATVEKDPHINFEDNPLACMKRARWFLDNCIAQEERK